MTKLSGLSHLFMTVFIYNFSVFMVVPAISDITMAALCPGEHTCSLAIYLTGIQQAVIIELRQKIQDRWYETIFRVLHGYAHMHDNEYLHRDFKPDNRRSRRILLKLLTLVWLRNHHHWHCLLLLNMFPLNACIDFTLCGVGSSSVVGRTTYRSRQCCSISSGYSNSVHANFSSRVDYTRGCRRPPKF